jgi:hypothetical protein
VSYAGVDGKTALDLLKTRAVVVTSGRGNGLYVTSINGYHANELGHEYWAMYVNGAMSDVDAAAYMARADDRIEWKIATY